MERKRSGFVRNLPLGLASRVCVMSESFFKGVDVLGEQAAATKLLAEVG